MKFKIPLIFIATTMASFLFRYIGISANHPFWVDEFSSANQARLILKYGHNIFNNKDIVFDAYHYGYHIILASFFKIFGQSEYVARLPSVIIGSLIPGLVFVLGYRIFNLGAGINGAILSAFSYFLITWSRQARGYVFLQFYILSTLILYYEVTSNKARTPLKMTLFLILLGMGLLTHSLFYIYVISLLLHYAIRNRGKWLSWFKKPYMYFIGITVFITSYLGGFVPSILNTYSPGNIILANNVWYYHSFLWREYGLITFLALLGFFFSIISRNKYSLFVVIYFLLHFVFICFLFEPYVSRYLLVIWPIILLFVGYFISKVSTIFSKEVKLNYLFIGSFLSIFIVINGHKFVTKPKTFYSVNHDFREIALVDYHQIYKKISDLGDLNNKKTAVIDTWPDRPYWYLGLDYPATYLFRWQSDQATTNGLLHKTAFAYNSEGEKILPDHNNLRFIGTLSDLKKAMNKYAKGFIIIDDSTLSKEITDYVKINFDRVIYMDHFEFDDNPYSIWPITLYSWGININKSKQTKHD